ncbi:hypothetical protein K492DRAFT_241007 [Lichtheimia hyalospora FSU 10163]|nr:hypothetical protein K492DRAFT_241007 [Lichtheimia hyalospora FSU 10163]
MMKKTEWRWVVQGNMVYMNSKSICTKSKYGVYQQWMEYTTAYSKRGESTGNKNKSVRMQYTLSYKVRCSLTVAFFNIFTDFSSSPALCMILRFFKRAQYIKLMIAVYNRYGQLVEIFPLNIQKSAIGDSSSTSEVKLFQ